MNDELTTQGDGEGSDAVKIGAMLNKQNASDIADAVANINTSVDRLMQVLQRAGVDISAMSGKSIDNAALDALAGGKLLATNTAAVKALGNGRVGGYLVMYGSPAQKDLQGEYFTPETELGLNWYTKRPALYHHGLDGTLEAETIGEIDTLTPDDIGVWAEAQLDMRKKYVQAVYALVEKGALGWSSGSIPHLVKIAAGGRIEEWPIVEGSLTPTPAEPRIVVSTLKAAHAIVFEEPETVKETPAPAAVDVSQIVSRISVKGHKSMDMQAMVASVLDALLAAFGESAPQLDDTQKQQIVAQVVSQLGAMESASALTTEQAKAQGDTIANAVMKAIAEFSNPRVVQNAALDAAKRIAATAEPKSKVPGGHQGSYDRKPEQISVASKFDALNVEDMSFLYSLNKVKRQDSDEFFKALADKATKAHNAGEMALDSRASAAVKSIKSNELNTSTQAGYGDEWVPDLWSDQIWKRMRLDNIVASTLQTWDMPSNPYELPIESTDPTVYYVGETADENTLLLSSSSSPIPDSKVATGKAQLSAKKLALRVGYSAEVDEDSIIPFASQLRSQAQRAMLDAIDSLILNGDTETGGTGNVNSDDAAPAATAKYLAFNGMRKLALVTATAQAVNGGGAAPTLTAFRTARSKLLNAYGMRPQDLVAATDYATYIKLLGLSEFLTIDKAGPLATAQKGVLGFMDGIAVAVSNEMALTEADGKINTSSPSSTLFGQIVLYAKYGWNLGYRRRVKVTLSYLEYYDSYQLVATARVALANRENTGVAVLYNLAV